MFKKDKTNISIVLPSHIFDMVKEIFFKSARSHQDSTERSLPSGCWGYTFCIHISNSLTNPSKISPFSWSSIAKSKKLDWDLPAAQSESLPKKTSPLVNTGECPMSSLWPLHMWGYNRQRMCQQTGNSLVPPHPRAEFIWHIILPLLLCFLSGSAGIHISCAPWFCGFKVGQMDRTEYF